MGTPIKGYSLDAIVSGGSVDKGERVFFRFRLEGGQEETLLCPHYKFARALTFLHGFATMAAEDRKKYNPQLDEKEFLVTSIPFTAKNIAVGASLTAQAVAIRILTQENIPVDILLNFDLARRVAEDIEAKIQESKEHDQQKPS